MTVSFEITRDDLLAYIAEHNSRLRTIRRAYRRGFIWGPVIGVVIVAITRVPELLVAAGLVGLTTFLYSVVWHLTWPSRLDKIARSMLAEGVMGGEIGHHTVVLESEGIREIAGWGDSLSKWRVIGRVTTTAHHIMIDMIGRGPAIVVPNRAFADGPSRDAFVSSVRERTREAAQQAHAGADEARA